MKRIRVILAIITFFILCSCGQESQDIQIETLSYVFKSGEEFEYIQIGSGLDDVQSAVNKTLETAATDWLTGECAWMAASTGEIVFQSEEYITIGYSLNLGSGDEKLRIFHTVNLEDGSRMFLNDFFEEEEFVTICKNEFPDWDEDKIKAIYQYASLSEGEYLRLLEQYDPQVQHFILSYLREKPDFFLTNRGITLKLSVYTDDDRLLTGEEYGKGGRSG